MPQTSVTTIKKSKAKADPYKRLKLYARNGQYTSTSLNKNLYKVLADKIGPEAVQSIAAEAARNFTPARTSLSRTAYVVQTLRSAAGLPAPRIKQEEKARRPSSSNKYTYAKLRVRDERGNDTTVSMPPSVMTRARRMFTTTQIREIVEAAAASYDPESNFTRSEYVQRVLRTRLGERVPSELQMLRRRLHLTNAQLASALNVSREEMARWEESGQIDSGPARALVALLWRGRLRVSAVLKKGRPA